MTVLLTRSVEDSDDLANKLRSIGIASFGESMFDIEFKGADYHNISNDDTVIFTSKNALRAIDCSDMLDAECFVVGNATAEAAKQHGFSKIRIANHDANSLLELISSKKKASESKLYYFCGEKVSLDLDQILSTRGYDIKRFCVYKAVPRPDLSEELKTKILAKEIKLVLLYSYHTAEIFLQLIKQNKLQEYLHDMNALLISNKLKSLNDMNIWLGVELFDVDRQQELIEKIKYHYD